MPTPIWNVSCGVHSAFLFKFGGTTTATCTQSHDCDDYSEDDSYDDSGDDDCHDNHASADLNSYGFVGGSKSAEPKLPTFSAGLNSLESRSSQS